MIIEYHIADCMLGFCLVQISNSQKMKPISTALGPDSQNDGQGMSIAEVERETGLGKDTLRVWERRYGFPQPSRDALGERLYPPEQLQRLRLIKRLIDDDCRPSKVVALPLDALSALVAQRAAQSRTSVKKKSVPSKVSEPSLQDEPRWMTWLAQDQLDAIKHQLQQLIWRQGLARVVDEVVGPLCVAVGEAWWRGDITVYQEHLFTQTLQSVLREAIAAVDASNQERQHSPRILLTTTPGEQHALGLLMAECHFALEACQRMTLGTSTPMADIVQAVDRLDIDVLALSFSAFVSRRDIQANVKWLRQQLPQEVEIWVGGAAAVAHHKFLPQQVRLMQRAGDAARQVQQWRQDRRGATISKEST
jgi:DNA-binding transcriptional MerR regulator/methylmalonyl-CoA mutase cobalamin-binding subunit